MKASSVTTQPFLRWAGSKRKLVPVLRKYFSKKYDRYVEPFAGSACLFFSLDVNEAILGDLNGELIRTYREVKHRLPLVLDELACLRKSKKLYYQLREIDPTELQGPARAARFIYLNRFSFNGLFRTNLRGKFNVPYGGVDSGKLPSVKVLTACSKRLRNVKLISGDFESTMALCKRGDFVYLDPPFSVKGRRVFREYHQNSFCSGDIGRLAKALRDLDENGIAFLVSYADSEEGRTLSHGFETRRVRVKRSIAGFSENRKSAYELLITNMESNQ